MFLLGISCLGLSVLPGFKWLFPSHVREAFSYFLFKYFLKPPLSSPPGTLMMQIFMLVMLAQWSPRLSFLSFFFPLLCSTRVISNTPSSSSLNSFFCLNYCAIDSFSCIFQSSYSIFHLCSFKSSCFLLNIFLYLLNLCLPVLFPNSGIIFTIITLNSFSGRLPISI